MKRVRFFLLLVIFWTGAGAWSWADTSPSAAYDPVSNRFLFVFERGDTRTSQIFGQILNDQGAAIGDAFAMYDATNNQRVPAVAYDSNNQRFLVVWSEDDFIIYGRVINADGTFASDEFPVSAFTESYQSNPALAHDPINDNFLVVWEMQSGLWRIDGQRISENGNRLDSIDLDISTDADYDHHEPTVAYDSTNANYLVGWHSTESSPKNIGISTCLVKSSDGIVSLDQVIVNTGTPQAAALGFDERDGRFYLVYQEEDPAATPGIYGQVLNPSGAPLGDNTVVSTTGTGQQAPTLAYDPNRGQFLVLWEDNRNDDTDIFGQWVAGNRVIGSEITLPPTNDNQLTPALAYNGTCGNMLAAFISSAAAADVVRYAFVGDLCPTDTRITLPGGASQAAYQMVSFPVTAQPDLVGQMESQWGTYEPTQWRLLRWDPEAGTYVEPDDEAWGADQACVPGSAYWFISREAAVLTIIGSPAPATGSADITLKPGWNQIGSPFALDIIWDSALTVSQGTTVGVPVTSAANTLTGAALWQWNGEAYTAATAMVQGQGYWLWNGTAADVVLSVPSPAGILRHLGGHLIRWLTHVPGTAIADEPMPPPPPGALEPAADSSSPFGADADGCFIDTVSRQPEG